MDNNLLILLCCGVQFLWSGLLIGVTLFTVHYRNLRKKVAENDVTGYGTSEKK